MYIVYCIEHVYCIVYTVYTVPYTLYSSGRQPMARGPNVVLFKKIMVLLKSRGAKTKPTKNFGRLAKKYELMALSKRRPLIFPFFGPPTTKDW